MTMQTITTTSSSSSITSTTKQGKFSKTNWIIAESSSSASNNDNDNNEDNDNNNNNMTLIKSPITKLRGLLIKTDEPLCTLHVIISTEAVTEKEWTHKDDGLPHTLEHLIFLGSKQYPYKGILDKLANRSLADGTNAWTATDHTCYTLTTAGSEGVLNLLPIYADHILYPTMTDESFVTEIHHITSDGKDKGVVYCEMQGRENNDGSLVDRKILDLLYTTDDKSGYSAETGGKLKNLRTLTNYQVKRYHTENYKPSKIMFVLSGNVDNVDEFINKVDEVENSIITSRRNDSNDNKVDGTIDNDNVDDDDDDNNKRPWHIHDIPPMNLNDIGVMKPPLTSKDDNGSATTSTLAGNNKEPKYIEFPSEDESRGTISIAWRSGPTYDNRLVWMKLRLLWKYFTESAASTLQKVFVECDEPLCADVSTAYEIFLKDGYMQLWFTEVDIDKMDDVCPLLIQTLIKEYHNDNSSFDIDRLHTIIKRYKRKLLERMERRPTDVVIDGVVRNFLYGPRGESQKGDDDDDNNNEIEMKSLKDDIDELPLLDIIENEIIQKGTNNNKSIEEIITMWKDLLYDYILSQPYVVVIGKPSSKLAKDMSINEKKREEQQAIELGEEKLAELGDILSNAMQYNERPIPESILTSIPIPKIENVKSIPLLTIRGTYCTGGGGGKEDEKEGNNLLNVAPNSGRDFTSEEISTILTNLQTSGKEVAEEASSYYVDWNHIDSKFVFVSVGLDTTNLSWKQRLYLPLLSELMFKLPAKIIDGGGKETFISKDEFVSELQNDTVSYSCNDSGLVGGSTISQMISISIQVENFTSTDDGFSKAMKWIRRVLYLTTISVDSVKIAVQRLISEIPPQIRDGPTIVRAVGAELNYDSELSNIIAGCPLRQKPFLASLHKHVNNQNNEEKEENNNGGSDDDAVMQIVKDLEDLRKELVQPHNMNLFVAGNMNDIPNPMQTLVSSLRSPFLDTNTTTTRIQRPPMGKKVENVSTFSVLKKRPANNSDEGGRAAICALSAIESGFLSIHSPGVGAYDPNHASLLVAIEYLTALEGDFWIKLRGAGLTYGSSIFNSTDSMLLKFSLYKCTDIAAAFEAASQILVDYASKKQEISSVDLENTKSSLAYGIISGTSTKLGAAVSAWTGQYEGKKVDYNRWLLSRIAEVTKEDVMHALVTYLVPIFDPKSNLAVACPVNKLDEVSEYFVKRGWNELEKINEDQLCTVFVKEEAGDGNKIVESGTSTPTCSVAVENNDIPDKVKGMSMFLPGAFAAQFRCACPKCDRSK